MTSKLFIHATNVHQGGGHSLLAAILKALPCRIETTLSLDSRMTLPEDLARKATVRRVEPSIAHRFAAEKWIADHVAPGDIVLCFGNLPPLFKLSGHVVVFVQNRYLIDFVKLAGFSLKTRLRLAAERLWFSFRMANADEFVVQTPTMKRLLEIKTRGKRPIRMLPFVAKPNGYARQPQHPKEQPINNCNFLYVASGEPHKNHRPLIEAWCLLAKEGLHPSLKLTVDSRHSVELCSWIEQKIEEFRLKVENLGCVPQGRLKQLYNQAGALIFPSTFESFGLPLIEACQAGLPILASELDYVRDVLDPEETFDPKSAVSIARAVKRFLNVEERPLPLQDAAGFMKSILEKAK